MTGGVTGELPGCSSPKAVTIDLGETTGTVASSTFNEPWQQSRLCVLDGAKGVVQWGSGALLLPNNPATNSGSQPLKTMASLCVKLALLVIYCSLSPQGLSLIDFEKIVTFLTFLKRRTKSRQDFAVA